MGQIILELVPSQDFTMDYLTMHWPYSNKIGYLETFCGVFVAPIE